ncbi:hypothetical protein [Jannaschia sp. LMIT008]|uniref:hypothetical protein n=1 Tax=Jannaschia maritima TaxID=3032585 RepID=UPI002811DA78|nr:hypothetical protein [Jannaschia sp. LMIT008]
MRIRSDGPDLGGAMAFRAAAFRGGADDRDRFDADAAHLTVEGMGTVAYARLLDPRRASYAGLTYDLRPVLARYAAPWEIGRVALQAGFGPDVARMVLSVVVDAAREGGADLLMGCTSMPLQGAPRLGALRRHVGPWSPGRRSGAETVPLGPAGTRRDLSDLLRLYLSLGAVVSDHAIVDRDLGTVHVCTMLPLADIPTRRLSALASPVAVG